MKTSNICPKCGKNNAEGKQYCVECGARLATQNAISAGNDRTTPAIETLQETWQAIRVHRDLRSSGAWNVLLGILVIAAGFTYVERSSSNSVLFVIGLVLIGTGIAVRRAPGPATSLANAIAMLLTALWNTILFVAAIVETSSRVQIVGGPAFFVPIIFAVMYFRTHARFVRAQHVSQDLVADLGREIKEIKKTKLSASDDLIAFRVQGRRWKGKLGTARVTLVTRNGRRARFARPGEFVMTAQGRTTPGKQGQITVETGTEAWKATAPYESLQHYEQWQATRTGDRQPPRDIAYRQVIDLLQEITGHVSSAPEDASQEERIARLVHMGPEAVPAAIGAVWSAIRYQDGDRSGLENAGLLCEAIGRMGGDKALNALARFATQESTIAGYAHVRAGALRGLAHLDDRRADPLIADALEDPDPGVRDAAAWALDRDRASTSALSSEERAPDATGEIPDQPIEAQEGKSASPRDETTTSAHVEGIARNGPASKKADAFAWVGIVGAIVYVGLVVLVFFVPQIPFCVGTIMVLPGVLGLVLAKTGGPGFFDRHQTGCMLMLASLVGGLILYGLLWLFQRPFFLSALETF